MASPLDWACRRTCHHRLTRPRPRTVYAEIAPCGHRRCSSSDRQGPVMAAPDMPVVRLTSPGEIAAAVPHLCGFLPSESLVAVSLRGERHRIGLCMRLDLPPAEVDEDVAEQVAA